MLPHTLRPLAALLALALVPSAVAQTAPTQPAPPPAAAPELTTTNSRFYAVHSNAEPEVVERWADHMDVVFESYARFFASLTPIIPLERMNLYLFATREDYVATLATFEIDGSTSGGMFFRTPLATGLAIFLGGLDDRDVESVLQHEGLHQFAFNYFANELPLWANEGLAEYFGNALVINDRLRLGQAPTHQVQLIKGALDAEAAIDFADLLAYTSDQWFANMATPDNPLAPLQYTQSWSIVHFLIHGNRGRYAGAFSNYLTYLTQGERHPTAFAHAFGDNANQAFGERWAAFVADDLEPDTLSQATERMNFLARGIVWLANEHDDSAAMGTLDEVLTRLTELEFALTRKLGDGRSLTVTPDDPDLIGVINRGRLTRFIQRPGRDRTLPRDLVAPGLSPAPRVTWSRDDDGKIQYQLRFVGR